MLNTAPPGGRPDATPMRVAWIGPAPTEGHGVPRAATNLLRGLAHTGAELECFVAAPDRELPAVLRSDPRIRFFCEPPRWEWEKWYSRDPISAFITGQLARATAQGRLAALAARRHAEAPYDVLYQFSQIELGRVRRLRRRLPPIVVHPEVHAAGELRWLRREARLARQCEPIWRRAAALAILGARTAVQRRDLRLARRVIAPSQRFAEHLSRDYDVPFERFGVVPNPIDLDLFAPPAEPRAVDGPLTVLFVSRMAVRKGVEMMVALSHRLADLAGRVRIELVGDGGVWSDYRPLLRELNPAVAHYLGSATAEMPDIYRSADIFVQPAHYEPFALTVGEAMASGLPVVASDEVGASEQVDGRCCRVFPSGDLAALEARVRGLLDELRDGAGGELGALARSEAERLFEPLGVGRRLAHCLELAA
jgi:glycosyltransferase involved in cell wall biosynthesis